MRVTQRFIWIAVALGWVATSAQAWSTHSWGTWLALNTLPDARTETVRAEPLEKFLLEQGAALEAVLQQEEQWARSKVRNYPARPEVLAYRFDSQADPAELRRRFLMAVRVNPSMPLPMHIQVLPTAAAQAQYGSRGALSWGEVSLHKGESTPSRKHVALREGESVSVLDVLATASDEPDEGLDTGLWSDSGTEHGRVYGFGPQPFSTRYGTHGDDAPFHMGFFHESPSTYATANGLRRAYPEYRMHLWQSLARHALVNGHTYWGWRFAGWAMHYAQDLTQPYHASFMPDRGALSVMWVNMLDFAGASATRQQATQLIAQRHQVVEWYQQQSMLGPLQRGEWDHPHLKPFAMVSKDAGRMALPENGLRNMVSLQAYRSAQELDALVASVFPSRWVQDPHVNLTQELATSPLYSQMQNQRPQALENLDQMLRDLSLHFGNVTRAVWRRLQ